MWIFPHWEITVNVPPIFFSIWLSIKIIINYLWSSNYIYCRNKVSCKTRNKFYWKRNTYNSTIVWMCVSFDFGKTSNSIIWDFYFYTHSRTRLVKQFSCSNKMWIIHEIIVYGVFFITNYQIVFNVMFKRLDKL